MGKVAPAKPPGQWLWAEEERDPPCAEGGSWNVPDWFDTLPIFGFLILVVT